MKYALILTLSILLFSCSNDQPVESKPQLDLGKLEGKWELTSATRNNRPTETLTGTFYRFNKNQVTTNLTPGGQEKTFRFQSDGNTIQLKDETDFMTFEIDSLSDSLLWMRTEIQGYKFQLALKKQMPDSTSVLIIDSLQNR